MKHIHPQQSERGHALAVFGLAVAGLTMLFGLIYQPVSQNPLYITSDALQQAVNEAALAGAGAFKQTESDLSQNIAQAALQSLDLNGVVPDPNAPFSDPTTGTVGVAVETCITNPADADLCPQAGETPHKRVRVRVRALAAPDGAPITLEATAQAANLDIILVVDTSDSMTYGFPGDSPMRDPHACNPHSCQPMEDVKAAARTFSDKLDYPYDRLGLVTFDQHAMVRLALSEDISEIHDGIDGVTVFDGAPGTPLVGGGTQGSKCIYYLNDPALQVEYRDLQDPVPPHASPPNTADYAQEPYGACRLYYYEGGPYWGMDCPMYYGPDPNPSRCGTTNMGDGFLKAGNALAGSYPSDARRVVIFLSDGAANSAYDSNGAPICPRSTYLLYLFCQDADSASRHDSSSELYDAGDYARDMIDFAATHADLIYSIGVGSLVTNMPPGSIGDPPGEATLRYAALAGNGSYNYAPDASSLASSYLDIYDEINTVELLAPIPTTTPTSSPTATLTQTVTSTLTPTPSPTPTITQTTTSTLTPTETYTFTPAPTSTATRTPTPITVTLKLKSIAAQDGWVRESKENSNQGYLVNTTGSAFQVGDDASNRQYKAILSFDTASLPDNAIIQKATLRIKKKALVGSNPFNVLGNLLVDIRSGPFSNNPALQAKDFQALPSAAHVGVFKHISNSRWYSSALTAAGRSQINITGLTQFRLYFKKDDNNNRSADYMKFLSGNAASDQPELIIVYSVPFIAPPSPTVTKTQTPTLVSPTLTPTLTLTPTITRTPTRSCSDC